MHEAIAITRDLIAIPSVNPMGSGAVGKMYSEKAISEYIHAFCCNVGLDSRITGNDPQHPNVVICADYGLQETVLWKLIWTRSLRIM